jgi:hypothetical protein
VISRLDRTARADSVQRNRLPLHKHLDALRELAMKYHTCVALVGALCATASAQNFDFTLDGSLSTTDLTSNFALQMPSFVTGSFNTATNPGGTITCPGTAGNCPNIPILMVGDMLAGSHFVTVPSGSLSAAVDVGAGSIVFSNVSVDALGGQSGSANLTLDLLYMTFHTLQPTALFNGGFTVPIPLGQVAASNVRFVQVGPPVPGTLTPSGIPDFYDVAASVPATMSFDTTMLGLPLSLGPIPVVLPLNGTLDLGGGHASLALFVNFSSAQTLTNPFGAQVFNDVPFDLPTILPPGNTAHLLFDIDPGDLGVNLTASFGWYSSIVTGPTCEAQNYCVSSPNTFGAGAHIANTGSTSVAANDFVLTCSGVPPRHPACFIIGAKQTSLPLGDGTLCVGGRVRFYRLMFADRRGNLVMPIDFAEEQHRCWRSAVIDPGSTWDFQLVYRDPLGMASTLNTSDALTVTFCP